MTSWEEVNIPKPKVPTYNIVVLVGEDQGGELWHVEPYSLLEKYEWANINTKPPPLTWEAASGFSVRGWRIVSVTNISDGEAGHSGVRVVMEIEVRAEG